MKILLVCERSGGHVFPALSFAKKINRVQNIPKGNIYFFVSSGFLNNYIKKEGFSVVGKAFERRNIFLEIFWRFFEAVYLLGKLQPQRVIGFGGRDSFWLVLLASFFISDTAIYEPNLKFGKANRVLSIFVPKVLKGFLCQRNIKKAKTVRIPLRENLRRIDKAKARQVLGLSDKPVILCFGGSQGSRFINRIFLKFLKTAGTSLEVIHFTGRDDFFEISQLYNKIGTVNFIRDFYPQMEIAYSAADVVICRSGASTLAEVSFYGLASILIPHPQAGGHQKDNALHFQKQGAALICGQDDFSFDRFSASLKKLIGDSRLQHSMGIAASKINLGVKFEDFAATADI